MLQFTSAFICEYSSRFLAARFSLEYMTPTFDYPRVCKSQFAHMVLFSLCLWCVQRLCDADVVFNL